MIHAQQLEPPLLQLSFRTDSLELAGDLVQDLFGSFLKLADCAPDPASFPSEMSRLRELLGHIEQHNQMKTHFASNIAESINRLKLFIVKAEAALMITDV